MSSPEPTGEICPKRFGLHYDPPSIVLEYLQVSTGKYFHRRIGLRRLRATSDPARVAEKLRQKNLALLAEDKVSFDQIVALVAKLQLGLLGNSAAAGAPAAAAGAGGTGSSAASGTGAGAGAGVRPAGAAGSAGGSNAGTSAASASGPAPVAAAVASPKQDSEQKSPPASASGSAGAAADGDAAAFKVDGELNLNVLSDEELARHKAQMDVGFFKNQKKPGDADYVYNVEVDFPEATQASGWDSDEDFD
eukprot:TRINITY_DN34961_c0_g1_i1.p1 TRINITY_DN34961_c0_g1~~TRINITY_DN34961_c0_g1_i1.p1  ORF type:complete len:249 (+),score=71.09 TRINITY_DN34961_c0_g1_i1:152-898(+)